jgi:hypothetical protein
MVNHLDEPAVLIPNKGSSPMQYPKAINPVVWTDLSHQPTWKILTQYCSNDARATSSLAEKSDGGLETIFIRNVTTSKGLCRNAEHENQHGFLSLLLHSE